MIEQTKESRLGETAIINGVMLFMVLVISFYGWHFVGKSIVPDAENWGQFGDYFGGVLNPAVAMAALFLLARSIGVQRTELSAAQSALSDQAQSAAVAAELAALTSLINAAQTEVQMHRDYLQFLVQQIAAQDQLALTRNPGLRLLGVLDPGDGKYSVHTIDGRVLSRNAAIRQLGLINDKVSDRLLDSLKHEEEIRALLAARRKKPEVAA